MPQSLADRVVAHAREYLASVGDRPVRATLSADALRERLGGPLPERAEDPNRVIDALGDAGRTGTVASQGPRYFGFVTGGSVPAAIAADWLVSAWDQNAQMFVMSPIAAVVEEIVSAWLKELFGLPRAWSVGFVTGAQMASVTALLAARHHLLRQADWDVERHGLFGAPPIDVVVSDEAHRTIFTALRMIGLGAERVRRVDTDAHGRMRPDHLARTLLHGGRGPCIVCAQVGNVNTGAADPIVEIAALARQRGAWLHVDGAFGLWAAAAPSRRSLAAGIEHADSIATDGHKWLVPYDTGIVLTAHPGAHQHALLMPAHYIQMTPGEREPRSFTPDESRRARGLPMYAALRSLGREGVGEIVDRCCRMAVRMAERLAAHELVRIMNEVVLNQVLVQFRPPGGDDDAAAALTERVVARVQEDATCWVGGTRWQGQAAMRISISNWSTTAEDIDRSAAAIVRALNGVS